MTSLKRSLIVLGALALSGAATNAYAQNMRPKTQVPSPAARDAYTLNESQQPQVLELDGGRRWGLNLVVRPPVTRETELRDVEAGAFYKLTPSIRLGGALGLTDAAAPTTNRAPDETTPRVRLGAIFKF